VNYFRGRTMWLPKREECHGCNIYIATDFGKAKRI
jgi:hypothetical protein